MRRRRVKLRLKDVYEKLALPKLDLKASQCTIQTWKEVPVQVEIIRCTQNSNIVCEACISCESILHEQIMRLLIPCESSSSRQAWEFQLDNALRKAIAPSKTTRELDSTDNTGQSCLQLYTAFLCCLEVDRSRSQKSVRITKRL